MTRRSAALAAAALTILLATAATRAQPVMRQHVATVSSPLFAAAPPGDTAHLFILERGGRIDVLNLPGNTLNATPFVASIPNLYTSGEGGLLGLTFDPNYADNGYFYIYYTTSNARIVERRTRSASDPLVSDPTSALTLISLNALVGIHNGGWLGFGNDGFLYISVGEHGQSSLGQDITDNLFGKMLRIDPSGDDFPADPARNYRIPPGNPFVGIDGDDEIWAYGLRNPWRCAFDRLTGDLYVADVGQSAWEEINILPAGVGGQNFGWGCREGFAAVGSCPDSPAYTPPVVVYGHGTTPVGPLWVTGLAIIGGPVYRGTAIPELAGCILFSDYTTDWLYAARFENGVLTWKRNLACELSLTGFNPIYGYGTDADGEVYICHSGGVDKIVPDLSAQTPDCNSNGHRDSCDIASGASYDLNQDGVPDECECLVDWDHNNRVEPADVAQFVTRWNIGAQQRNLAGDVDHNDRTDPADVAVFIQLWFVAASNGGC